MSVHENRISSQHRASERTSGRIGEPPFDYRAGTRDATEGHFQEAQACLHTFQQDEGHADWHDLACGALHALLAVASAISER